ncbi:riboflavin synthase [Alkalihalobacillus trypoxylicola]|uniref:Riboflavin synthase n=1 Tax=Alkalihalobacillus trypoxylicola TaxID=519424 RepID=A0A161QKZ9_9BACI|nr:riboflavin synthase [Alkalihalobacillus trypoxylicola]KYG30727.1 riboflavin synthase subunit alpha [Alkalihalobacillus trypoxylicola]
MFTGIIEEKGKIEALQRNGNAMVMTIKASKVIVDVHLGDSISINGVCLTVVSFNHHHFSVDIMPETIYSTSLEGLKKGDEVNLERAMSANSRFGGHIVSGHVDGVGTILSKKREHNAVYFQISVKDRLSRYIIPKGSVAVDGISLTVFDVTDHIFTISIIPHTLQETILGSKQIGDIVNIECDIIGKYVERMLGIKQEETPSTSKLNQTFLEENGFS